MPFIPLSGSTIRDWVTAPAVRIYRSRQNGRDRLTFGISGPLLAELGWSQADRIVVSLGTGTDAGAFRMHRGDRGGGGVRLARFGNHACRLHVVLPPQFYGVDTAALLAGRTFPLLADVTREGGALQFTLPAAEEEDRVVTLKPKSINRNRKVRA